VSLEKGWIMVAPENRESNGPTTCNGVAQRDDASPASGTAPSGHLLDKVRFYVGALEHQHLDGGACRVLATLTFRLAGAGHQAPDRGWCAMGTLAALAGLSVRNTRAALERLVALGLVEAAGVRGRGGRTFFRLLGMLGAAKLPLQPLGRSTQAPTETGRPQPISEQANRSPTTHTEAENRSPATHLNRSPATHESIEQNQTEKGESTDQDARGRARGGGQPTRGFQKLDKIERPRRRLLARLQGLARSRGLDPGIAETILAQQSAEAIEAMLDLQHEGDNQAVAARLADALAAHFGVIRSQEPPRARRAVYSPVEIHKRTMERLEREGFFDDDPPESPPHDGPTIEAEAIHEATEPTQAPASLPAPQSDPKPAMAAPPASPSPAAAGTAWRPPARGTPVDDAAAVANHPAALAKLQEQVAALVWQVPTGSGDVALTR
jgi:hypothetical protein